uniref:Uncharacterized protein n=1 Tax=Ditylenchus dipsaci TaxID=166011 RepID=A0A915DIJ5_9BILA
MLLSYLKRWLLEFAAIAISSFTYFKNPFGAEDSLFIHSSLPLLKLQDGQWRFPNTNDYIGDCSSKWMASYQNFPLDKQNLNKVIANGWNKHVYSVGKDKVIKKIYANGVSTSKCHRELDSSSTADTECIRDVANGFIKEIGFLLKLQGDPSVPKLFAYCIPQDFSYNFHQLSIIVSSGSSPLDMIYLLQIKWKTRLKITSDILDFVHRIWPVQLHDFRRQQFVMSAQKSPVYVDFDDASEVKKCEFAGDVNCIDTLDQDFEYGAKSARKAYEDFSKNLFWIGAPEEAFKRLKDLKHAYANNTLDVPKFQKILKDLLAL